MTHWSLYVHALLVTFAREGVDKVACMLHFARRKNELSPDRCVDGGGGNIRCTPVYTRRKVVVFASILLRSRWNLHHRIAFFLDQGGCGAAS